MKMPEEGHLELPVNGTSGAAREAEPVTAEPVKAASSSPRIIESGRQSARGQWKWTDIAMVAFTLGLVVVGILQTRIFDKQWQEMVASSADTHELAVAAEQQARASEAQANEAKVQVEKLTESLHKTDLLIRQETTQAKSTQALAAVSKSSLGAAQKSTQLDERAWVGVQTEMLSSYASGKPVKAVISFLNTGKSPALRITYTTNLAILKKGDKPAFLFDWQINNWSGVQPLPPQGVYQMFISQGGVLYDEAKARIDHQQDIVWVWGTIQYEDVFDHRHATRFCGYTLNTTSEQPVTQGELLKNCPEYSDMD